MSAPADPRHSLATFPSGGGISLISKYTVYCPHMETTIEKLKISAKDFFLYIGAMVGLYWSGGSLVALLFAITDTVFKDDLQYYVDPYSGGIRFAIASLLVVFPVTLGIFSFLKRAEIREPARSGFPIRRFLFALTIFITSIALIGDLIALINTFLGGELTARFLFKVFSILVVAGIVFWYCLLEIRVTPDSPAGSRKAFLVGTALFVLSAVVYGFFVMGSPATIRKLRFDERRISELSMIQSKIVSEFWYAKGRLPATLSELNDPISGSITLIDPETRETYEYSTTGRLSFTLCANFNFSSKGDTGSGKGVPTPASPVRYSEFGGQDWSHTAGRACFERTIDPELNPVRPKGV